MTKTELLKVRVTMNSEVVNNMYKMRYDDINVLNFADVSLIINQLELIEGMLEGAMGKEKKEIRVSYLRECKKYFEKMINCDYTYNIRVMGRTDIDIVLRKSRIYKTDLARLYYAVKVYKMTLVKYRLEKLDRVEKGIEKEVELIKKDYELLNDEQLQKLLNENHDLNNIIVPILRKRGLTLYQYTENNGYEWV